MNKKGFGYFIIALIALMTIGVISVVFFSAMSYGIDYITDTVAAIPDENNVSIASASNDTLGYLNVGMGQLTLISAMIMLGFIVATFITAYFSSEHPVMIVLYLFILAVMVISSVYIQNMYTDLLTDQTIGTVLAEHSIVNYFITHLTTVLAVIGFMGIVIMTINIIRMRNE